MIWEWERGKEWEGEGGGKSKSEVSGASVRSVVSCEEIRQSCDYQHYQSHNYPQLSSLSTPSKSMTFLERVDTRFGGIKKK